MANDDREDEQEDTRYENDGRSKGKKHDSCNVNKCLKKIRRN